MTELQEKLINMLKWFSDICEKENLVYYALGGTTLGAIRHNGFIPWDDDMDIGMPREDYERFLKLTNGKYYNESFFVESPLQNRDYLYAFSKIYDTKTTLVENTRYKLKRGIYIDVFPIDGLGNDQSKIIKNFKKIKIRNNLLVRLNSPYGKKLRVIKDTALFLSRCIHSVIYKPSEIIKSMGQKVKLNKFDESDYVANIFGAWGEREIMKREWFGTPTKHKFEDVEIYIPENYDEYLKRLYGDYMQLPPEEKRKSHHNFLYLSLDKSYLS